MALIMNPIHLEPDELEYECIIRGIDKTTRKAKEKELQKFLDNKKILNDVNFDSDLMFDEDVKCVDKVYRDIYDICNTQRMNLIEMKYPMLTSRCIHMLSRLQRIKPINDVQEGLLQSYVAKAQKLANTICEQNVKKVFANPNNSVKADIMNHTIAVTLDTTNRTKSVGEGIENNDSTYVNTADKGAITKIIDRETMQAQQKDIDALNNWTDSNSNGTVITNLISLPNYDLNVLTRTSTITNGLTNSTLVNGLSPTPNMQTNNNHMQLHQNDLMVENRQLKERLAQLETTIVKNEQSMKDMIARISTDIPASNQNAPSQYGGSLNEHRNPPYVCTNGQDFRSQNRVPESSSNIYQNQFDSDVDALIANNMHLPMRFYNQKTIPIHKWPLKFTGEYPTKVADALPWDQFLERIDRMMISERTTCQDVFERIEYLLVGSARKWFNAYSTEMRTWEEFKSAFKQQYQYATHDVTSIAFLTTRRQEYNESPSDYFHSMIAAVKRMPIQLDDRQTIVYILRGFKHDVGQAIGLQNPQSLERLRALVRQAEMMEVNKRNNIRSELIIHHQNESFNQKKNFRNRPSARTNKSEMTSQESSACVDEEELEN